MVDRSSKGHARERVVEIRRLAALIPEHLRSQDGREWRTEPREGWKVEDLDTALVVAREVERLANELVSGLELRRLVRA